MTDLRALVAPWKVVTISTPSGPRKAWARPRPTTPRTEAGTAGCRGGKAQGTVYRARIAAHLYEVHGYLRPFSSRDAYRIHRMEHGK